MNKQRKKRSFTLLEIMIVIFLIGLIGSVIGYNVKGSLDEGRAFRSEQGACQIRDILLLEVAKGYPLDKVLQDKEKFLRSSGLVKDVKKLLKDGWGDSYEIVSNRYGTDIIVRSSKLKAYKDKKKGKLGPTEELEEDIGDEEL
ncbi:MAG: type II secretion system protein [Chlamydiae bacterium]|nr:type II secretion system protein [Chlamydiota bacterium]